MLSDDIQCPPLTPYSSFKLETRSVRRWRLGLDQPRSQEAGWSDLYQSARDQTTVGTRHIV